MTIVMHHHIYKNAGTTVDWILQRNFPGNVLHIEGGHPGARLTPTEVREAATAHPHHAGIASHTTPLPAREQAWAVCHLTILRHPVERFYSMYRYDRRRDDDNVSSRIAKDSDFRSYTEWWLRKRNSLIRNWQVRCCTPQTWVRTAHNRGLGLGWDADLSAACHTIEDVAFAGVAEQFDESMVVLESLLREHDVAFDATYVRQNASSSKTVLRTEAFFIEELGQPLYDDLLHANAMDFELLEHAQRLLSLRFRQLTDGPMQLENFSRRCAALAEGSEEKRVRVPTRPDWLFIRSSTQLDSANRGAA